MNILMLGAGAGQLDYIKHLKKSGHRLTVVDVNPQAAGFNYADKKIISSMHDGELLWRTLQEQCYTAEFQQVLSPIGGVGACTAADIARRLKLPALPHAMTAIMQHKGRLREVLNSIQPCPLPYAVLVENQNPYNELDRIGYPVVIKPAVGGHGGRGVSIVADKGQVAAALRLARAHGGNKEVLIERYVHGAQFDVNMIYQNGRFPFLSVGETIRDMQNTGLPVGETMGRGCPMFIEQVVKALFSQLCESFQLQHAVLHSNILLDREGGLYIIDIKNCLDDALKLAPLAYDYDLLANCVHAFLSQPVQTAPPPRQAAAIHYFLHPAPLAKHATVNTPPSEQIVQIHVDQPMLGKYHHNGVFKYLWAYVLVTADEQQHARTFSETVMQGVQFRY